MCRIMPQLKQDKKGTYHLKYSPRFPFSASVSHASRLACKESQQYPQLTGRGNEQCSASSTTDKVTATLLSSRKV